MHKWLEWMVRGIMEDMDTKGKIFTNLSFPMQILKYKS